MHPSLGNNFSNNLFLLKKFLSCESECADLRCSIHFFGFSGTEREFFQSPEPNNPKSTFSRSRIKLPKNSKPHKAPLQRQILS